jgi:hypothetical protein
MFKKIYRTIALFGNIEYKKSSKEWFGLVDNICPNNKVELNLSVNNKDEELNDKIELVKKFALDYENIISKLYDLAYKKYKDTQFEVTRTEIEEMYFLSAVNLKEDNKTWWLVLEPNFNVTSVYDHLLRFTMLEREIIWANFNI